jgi:hypothetical protein
VQHFVGVILAITSFYQPLVIQSVGLHCIQGNCFTPPLPRGSSDQHSQVSGLGVRAKSPVLLGIFKGLILLLHVQKTRQPAYHNNVWDQKGWMGGKNYHKDWRCIFDQEPKNQCHILDHLTCELVVKGSPHTGKSGLLHFCAQVNGYFIFCAPFPLMIKQIGTLKQTLLGTLNLSHMEHLIPPLS